MPNYHLEIKTIGRRQGQSVTGAASYICGRNLQDNYTGKHCYNHREDVVWQKTILPGPVPPDFGDLQYLCNAIEEAEVRRDARTARQLIGALPNELPLRESLWIVETFIARNFTAHDLCAIAAIHEGKNTDDPSRNNPHAHIIVSTRTVGPDGFSKHKYREQDRREYVNIWREQWAALQNRAYMRNHLDIRVSHESLEVQGIDRAPTIHLPCIDWRREQRGERTPAGDRKREIEKRNAERLLQEQRKQEHGREIDQSRRRG